MPLFTEILNSMNCLGCVVLRNHGILKVGLTSFPRPFFFEADSFNIQRILVGREYSVECLFFVVKLKFVVFDDLEHFFILFVFLIKHVLQNFDFFYILISTWSFLDQHLDLLE